MLDDAKMIIRNRKSKKDRQYNDQKKKKKKEQKYKNWSTRHYPQIT